MKKQLKKNISLVLTSAFVITLLAGCTKDETPSATTVVSPAASAAASETKAPESGLYYDMYDKVKDSSELPDWKGNQLKLKVWYAHGTGDAKRPSSTNDVVNPEIKRVTGVEIDKDTSYDNGGQAIDVKLGMMNAANDWPDLALVTTSGMGNLKDMIAAGKAYDLTEAIQKYAPNLSKRLSFETFPEAKTFVTNHNPDGKLIAFPTMLGEPDRSLKMIDPTFVTPNAQNGPDGFTGLWVRDDLLKMLYPTAKSQDEIEALYLKNGAFTKEEIYDVPVKTKEDVTKLLYDMQNLIKTKDLKENGKPIQVSYAFGGQDNWGALAVLSNLIDRRPGGNNYFTYYDKITKKVEFMFQQDFFKQDVLGFNKLVRDGVMDKNSLLENNGAHLEKLNNGQYAVAYIYDTPDENILKKANKTFRYRKLWLDSPVQSDKFITAAGPVNAGVGVIVFKDKVKEADLPQVIRYLDYLISEVGEKMYTWGPKSAGLFDETADGKRVFKDKELEEAMVYHKDNGKSMLYNLSNTKIGSTSTYGNAWPYYPTYMWSGSTVTPAYAYTKVKTAADGMNFFDPGNLPNNSTADHSTSLLGDPQIWSFFGSVPSTDKFWKGRDAFEKALTKTMAAKDDAQFEELWKSFSDIAVKNGATPQTLIEINDYFTKKNEGYLDKIK